ncbi:hypothetical protein Tther_01707 [Tepidimonas thermarum]|uniref:Uncharacterized protein n=1 Tax=Tepidimonas thermarum TaxID=335431 RepID=A0A554X006_9BURK|nr:hypothetical protein Tther_01707 [Tepidimonas thermarum]
MDVFKAEAEKLKAARPGSRGAQWLAQGTIYPDVIESGGQNAPAQPLLAQHLHQRVRLGGAAVGHEQLRGAGFQQGHERAAGRTTGAQQQHAPAGDGLAQVGGDVAHQSDAVEVFGQAVRAVEAQGVGRTGDAGARAHLGGIRTRLELERQGDVDTAPAGGAKGVHRRGKAVQGGFDGGVDQRLARGLGKQGVDQGRLAVADGVADHGIAVHGGIVADPGWGAGRARRRPPPPCNGVVKDFDGRMAVASLACTTNDWMRSRAACLLCLYCLCPMGRR